jgi:hypothetical protein
MPLPLIAIILGAAAALTVVVLAIVYYEEILGWFRKRNDLKVSDRANIAFTIKQKLRKGEFKVVQGIFNTRTAEVVDGQVLRTRELDEELAEVHRVQELVIYE